MKKLGPGFQERIYKNALLITLKQKGLQVETEQPFDVVYRGIIIGLLINFRYRKLEYKRLHRQEDYDDKILEQIQSSVN